MDITQLLVPACINVAKYNGGQYLGVGLRTFARLQRVPGNKDEFASANAESRKTLSSSTSKLITSSEKTWVIVNWHQHYYLKNLQDSPLCKMQTHPDDLLQNSLPVPKLSHID